MCAETVTSLEILAREIVAERLQKQDRGGNGRNHDDQTVGITSRLQQDHPDRLPTFVHAAQQGRNAELGGIPGAFSDERLAPKIGEALLYRTTRPCVGPPKYGMVYYEWGSVEWFAVNEDLPPYWNPVNLDPVQVDPEIIGKGTLRRSGNMVTHADGSQSMTPRFANEEEKVQTFERLRLKNLSERRRLKREEDDFGLPIHGNWPE